MEPGLSRLVMYSMLAPNSASMRMPLMLTMRGRPSANTVPATLRVIRSVVTVTVVTDRQTRSVAGTVYADDRPRIINIKGIRMDAEFGPSMIYITNQDKPGFIGRFSSTLGEAGINIATFHVGREAPGGNAIALIEIDGELPEAVLTKVRALPQVQQAKPLRF